MDIEAQERKVAFALDPFDYGANRNLLVGAAGIEPARSTVMSSGPSHLAQRLETGRNGVIRTPGPLVPNEVRYQTALHSAI